MLTEQQKQQLTSYIENTTPCLVTDALIQCIEMLLENEQVILRTDDRGSLKEVVLSSNGVTII